ncbi:MAG: hypothetical protein FWH07_04200 [Oscillospiraceae bacterium]|nr:hypothetical protein [Oscillospiraceae bacterium]
MRIKRNYQFVQFLLDFFALFEIYIIAVCIIDIFAAVKFNSGLIRAEGGEVIQMYPNPVIIWGILAVIVFLVAFILPFLYCKRTKLNQKQYDMWVYAVYLIRILALLIVFYMLEIHASFIKYNPRSIFDLGILTSAVLIAIIVRFTQIRIKTAETKKEKRNLEEG